MIRSTFAVPALIALATLVGLGIALTGDGWRDVPAWIALGLPVAAFVWARSRRPSPSSRLRKGQTSR